MSKRMYIVLTIAAFLAVGGLVEGYKISTITSSDLVNVTPTITSISPKNHVMNWHQNGQNSIHWVKLAQGRLEFSTVGTVLTDTDCTPDFTGLSHCHDVIRLKNHTLITVINPHDMNYVACLTSGQAVTISPKANKWVVLTSRNF